MMKGDLLSCEANLLVEWVLFTFAWHSPPSPSSWYLVLFLDFWSWIFSLPCTIDLVPFNPLRPAQMVNQVVSKTIQPTNKIVLQINERRFPFLNKFCLLSEWYPMSRVFFLPPASPSFFDVVLELLKLNLLLYSALLTCFFSLRLNRAKLSVKL